MRAATLRPRSSTASRRSSRRSTPRPTSWCSTSPGRGAEEVPGRARRRGGPGRHRTGEHRNQGWAAQEALADVSDKFNGWSEGKDILPDLVKNAQLDGKQYGVPWYAGVRAVYYRTDWFAEAGVKTPTNWDEMVAAAKAVQAKKPGTYGIALPGNSELPFYSFLWGAGGEIATKEGDSWKSGYNTPRRRRRSSSGPTW
ncbi:extracellular solute-binding protein [Micromonospora sp. BRA006-A]|nr:extracellular solute-binding protein [Micromonospora sp. BRA006-A]